MTRFNIHAGHNPDGKVACGASGVLKESTIAREITNLVVAKLQAQGHTAYNCTCDNGTSVIDVLKKICSKSNSHSVDLDVSIHLNCGGGHGTEVLVYNTNEPKKTYATNVLNNICALGYTNRGIKIRTDLYVLKHTKAPCILIETLFCDSKDDCARYNADTMANAIVKGLTGKAVEPAKAPEVKHVGYQAHTQNVGWQDVKYDGATAGLTGQSKRLEAFKIFTCNGGTVEDVKVHIQDKGWVDYANPGKDTVIGTTGQSKRIEDIIIKLSGYKFRVHVQNFGWTSWTDCDGVSSLGSVGQALRIEAIQVVKK